MGEAWDAAWPSASSYVLAIQDPSARGPAPLDGLALRHGVLGLPAAVAGQHAVVFAFEEPTGPVAVKCFTSAPGDAARHRYRLLGDHVRAAGATPIAPVTWHDRGVLVEGRWWPVVTMPWLPGSTLDVAVAARRHDPEALRRVALGILRLTHELSRHRVAHGDLQHANLLVDDDDEVRAVDYDGVWLPGAEALPPAERGHRAYQHPQRLRDGGWGPWIDTTPALVLHLSVVALAADPSLWGRFHDGENLIVRPADLLDPTGSEVLAAFDASEEPGVRAEAALLRRCLAARADTLPPVGRLLDPVGAVRPDLAPDVAAPGAEPHWAPAHDPAGGDRTAPVPDAPPRVGAPPAAGEFTWSPTPPRRSPGWRRRG